jgi:hypothetical protein
MLGKCYKTLVRPCPDLDFYLPIRWYKVPPDTPFLDFPCAFVSSVYDNTDFEQIFTVGEQRQWGIYTCKNELYPYARGVAPIGPVDWWQNGIPKNQFPQKIIDNPGLYTTQDFCDP